MDTRIHIPANVTIIDILSTRDTFRVKNLTEQRLTKTEKRRGIGFLKIELSINIHLLQLLINIGIKCGDLLISHRHYIITVTLGGGRNRRRHFCSIGVNVGSIARCHSRNISSSKLSLTLELSNSLRGRSILVSNRKIGLSIQSFISNLRLTAEKCSE